MKLVQTVQHATLPWKLAILAPVDGSAGFFEVPVAGGSDPESCRDWFTAHAADEGFEVEWIEDGTDEGQDIVAAAFMSTYLRDDGSAGHA